MGFYDKKKKKLEKEPEFQIGDKVRVKQIGGTYFGGQIKLGDIAEVYNVCPNGDLSLRFLEVRGRNEQTSISPNWVELVPKTSFYKKEKSTTIDSYREKLKAQNDGDYSSFPKEWVEEKLYTTGKGKESTFGEGIRKRKKRLPVGTFKKITGTKLK